MEQLARLSAGTRGQQHDGEAARETDEQQASRLLHSLLAQAGWDQSEVRRRSKTDDKKARMAAQLRAQTSMTWAWIASHLVMGHWRTAADASRMARHSK